MAISPIVKQEIDNLEQWLLISFFKQMGRPIPTNIINDYDVHIRPPKEFGGVFSVLITSKRRDDFLRLLVYIDRFEQFVDNITRFNLTQEQNYGPGVLDEVFVAYASISKIKYPELYRYTASRQFLNEIVNADYYLLMEDGSKVLLEKGVGKILTESKFVV